MNYWLNNRELKLKDTIDVELLERKQNKIGAL